MRIFLLLCVLAMTGCASTPDDPVSKVAYLGGEVIEAVNIVQRTAVDAEKAGQIPQTPIACPTQKEPMPVVPCMMIHARTAGQYAQSLADALEAYDRATTDRGPLIERIGNLTRDLEGVVKNVTGLSFGGVTDQVLKLWQQVNELIARIRKSIPGLFPATPVPATR